MDAPIESIDLEELHEVLSRYNLLLAQCERVMPPNGVLPSLATKIAVFREAAPSSREVARASRTAPRPSLMIDTL